MNERIPRRGPTKHKSVPRPFQKKPKSPQKNNDNDIETVRTQSREEETLELTWRFYSVFIRKVTFEYEIKKKIQDQWLNVRNESLWRKCQQSRSRSSHAKCTKNLSVHVRRKVNKWCKQLKDNISEYFNSRKMNFPFPSKF